MKDICTKHWRIETFVINVNFHCVTIAYPKIESELIQYVHTSVCKYLSRFGSGSITMHLWVSQHHLIGWTEQCIRSAEGACSGVCGYSKHRLTAECIHSTPIQSEHLLELDQPRICYTSLIPNIPCLPHDSQTWAGHHSTSS